jgi:anti-sigma factor RsiW
MATNTDPQLNMDEIRDLLSPYLDGEVTDAERAWVEHALQNSPELAAELESLRQTVTWLAELPAAVAPRPFTLAETDLHRISPEEGSKSSRWFSFPAWAAGLAALAAIMLVILVGGGLLFSARIQYGRQAPDEIALQQESAAPAVEQAEMAASSAPEADTTELEVGEPLATEIMEQPAEEAPAPPSAMVVEESAAEQELQMEPQPTIVPTHRLEKTEIEEQPVLVDTPAKEPARSLAAEVPEAEERVEQEAADDAAEDTAMMAAPADEAEGQAGSGGALEPAGTITATPVPELATPVPADTPDLAAEADAARVSETPTGENLAAATPTAITPTPTATDVVPASPVPTETPAVIAPPRTFGSRGISLVLGILVVIIIAGVGVWLLSRRVKEN